MIIIVFAAALIAILAISRRKLGYFGLAVMAGAVLDSYWNKNIVDFLTTSSLKIPGSSLSGIVGLLLILLPAFLIVAKDQKREKLLSGIFPSFLMGVLALALCANILGKVFVFDDLSVLIVANVSRYSDWIILVGFLWSIMSVLSISGKKVDKKA